MLYMSLSPFWFTLKENKEVEEMSDDSSYEGDVFNEAFDNGSPDAPLDDGAQRGGGGGEGDSELLTRAALSSNVVGDRRGVGRGMEIADILQNKLMCASDELPPTLTREQVTAEKYYEMMAAHLYPALRFSVLAEPRRYYERRTRRERATYSRMLAAAGMNSQATPARVTFTISQSPSFFIATVMNTEDLPTFPRGYGCKAVLLLLIPLAYLPPDRLERLPPMWRQLEVLPQVCVIEYRNRDKLALMTRGAGQANQAGGAEGRVQPNWFATLPRARPIEAEAISVLSLRSYSFMMAAIQTVPRLPPFAETILNHPVARQQAVDRQFEMVDFLGGEGVRQSLVSGLSMGRDLVNMSQSDAVASCLYNIDPRWAERAGLLQEYPCLRPRRALLVRSPSLFIIEGPPGTGKTQTVGVLLLNLLKHTRLRVLVCANSNRSVDEVLLRLLSLMEGAAMRREVGDLIRIGVPEKVDEKIRAANPLLYGDDIAMTRLYDIKLAEERTAESRQRVAAQYTRKNGRTEVCEELLKCVDTARVVCSTLGSVSFLQSVKKFDVVIEDEASQATEPEVLQAFALAKASGHAVLVGDSKQLNPIVLCADSARKGFERSLLSRLSISGYPTAMLTTQYRMHPDIVSFANEFVYNNRLETDPSVNSRYHRDAVARKMMESGDPCFKRRLQFVDVPQGVCTASDRSYNNVVEANRLVEHMRKIRGLLGLSEVEFARHCGILTYYRAQCDAIYNALTLREQESGIPIATVDSYQGREMLIVLISCVRTAMPQREARRRGNEVGEQRWAERPLGFLSDLGRANVSLTRAKELCVVFGHRQTLTRAAEYITPEQVADPFNRDRPDIFAKLIAWTSDDDSGAAGAASHQDPNDSAAFNMP